MIGKVVSIFVLCQPLCSRPRSSSSFYHQLPEARAECPTRRWNVYQISATHQRIASEVLRNSSHSGVYGAGLLHASYQSRDVGLLTSPSSRTPENTHVTSLAPILYATGGLDVECMISLPAFYSTRAYVSFDIPILRQKITIRTEYNTISNRINVLCLRVSDEQAHLSLSFRVLYTVGQDRGPSVARQVFILSD